MIAWSGITSILGVAAIVVPPPFNLIPLGLMGVVKIVEASVPKGGVMFQSGDSVYLKDSAQADIGGYAWSYVVNHRKAQIVSLFLQGSNVNLPESESLYIVVWPEKFDGGWDCWHGCMAGYGQIVTHKNMELVFEESRDVVTVPNLDRYSDHEKITK